MEFSEIVARTTPKKRGRPAKPRNAMTGEIIRESEPAPEPAKGPKYSITLVASGNVTESEGYSMYEALKNLKKPEKITTKATIRIAYDGKEKEIYYTPNKLKRVFYPIAQELLAKSYALDLK